MVSVLKKSRSVLHASFLLFPTSVMPDHLLLCFFLLLGGRRTTRAEGRIEPFVFLIVVLTPRFALHSFIFSDDSFDWSPLPPPLALVLQVFHSFLFVSQLHRTYISLHSDLGLSEGTFSSEKHDLLSCVYYGLSCNVFERCATLSFVTSEKKECAYTSIGCTEILHSWQVNQH